MIGLTRIHNKTAVHFSLIYFNRNVTMSVTGHKDPMAWILTVPSLPRSKLFSSVDNSTWPYTHILHMCLFFLSVLFNDTVNCWDYTEKLIDKWNVIMEHWWNDTGRGKPKYSEKSLARCHIFHHSSNMCKVSPNCVSREIDISLSLATGHS